MGFIEDFEEGGFGTLENYLEAAWDNYVEDLGVRYVYGEPELLGLDRYGSTGYFRAGSNPELYFSVSARTGKISDRKRGLELRYSLESEKGSLRYWNLLDSFVELTEPELVDEELLVYEA